MSLTVAHFCSKIIGRDWSKIILINHCYCYELHKQNIFKSSRNKHQIFATFSVLTIKQEEVYTKKMTGKEIFLGLILVGLTCSYPLKKVSYVGDIDISSVY